MPISSTGKPLKGRKGYHEIPPDHPLCKEAAALIGRLGALGVAVIAFMPGKKPDTCVAGVGFAGSEDPWTAGMDRLSQRLLADLTDGRLHDLTGMKPEGSA